MINFPTWKLIKAFNTLSGEIRLKLKSISVERAFFILALKFQPNSRCQHSKIGYFCCLPYLFRWKCKTLFWKRPEKLFPDIQRIPKTAKVGFHTYQIFCDIKRIFTKSVHSPLIHYSLWKLPAPAVNYVLINRIVTFQIKF